MAARFIGMALCGALSAWPLLVHAEPPDLVVATPQGQAAPDLEDVDSQVERARALFWSAHERYDAGEYAEAAQLFEESYAVFPQPEVLFNIALARARSGRCGDAERAFDEYSQAIASSEATRAANFQDLSSECSEASAASPAVSELPEPAPKAAATGASPAPGPKPTAIVLPPPAPGPADTPPPSYWTTQRVVGWSLLGAAAAATGVAIYFDNQRRDAFEASSDEDNTGDHGAELEDQYNRSKIGIAVATTTALSCAAVGVGLLVYSGDGAASTTAQVALDPSGARVGVSGRF